MPDGTENSGTLPDWRTLLPEDLRFSDRLSKFKDAGSLAKSYMDLESEMGKRISLPGEDAKDEELNAFYAKWGRPEKHDAYEFPKELPEGLHIDENFGGSVKALAHKLGLNKRQFNQLVTWGVEQSQGMMLEQQKESELSEKALKDKWGFRFNDNIEKSDKALAFLVGGNAKHPFLDYLEQSGMKNSPQFREFLLEFGQRFSEHAFINPDVQRGEMDKQAAEKRIKEIRSDPKHPYWLDSAPGHIEAVKEMQELYNKAFGV